MVKLPPGTPGVTSVGVPWGVSSICCHKQPETLMKMNHLNHLMRLIHLIQMGHLKHYHEIVKNLSYLYSICDSVVKILS